MDLFSVQCGGIGNGGRSIECSGKTRTVTVISSVSRTGGKGGLGSDWVWRRDQKYRILLEGAGVSNMMCTCDTCPFGKG